MRDLRPLPAALYLPGWQLFPPLVRALSLSTAEDPNLGPGMHVLGANSARPVGADALIGPLRRLSSTTGQRQRKSAQRVSRTSPGWRGSQGPDVSLSDRRKGSPTFPRRNMFSFPPGAVSPTAPVRRSTSVPSKSPHHEQDKKECTLWQSI